MILDIDYIEKIRERLLQEDIELSDSEITRRVKEVLDNSIGAITYTIKRDMKRGKNNEQVQK